ncbi:MAG TPA: histidine--tRNA ligase [Candidatus Limnocylindria bacterium]|nr:histidine--tRNA ligase [Candidatus Limnocylindria bacterium]
MSLSTQPYKGARDFYPEDKRIQKYMFSTMRKVVEKFGYEEYDAPILEPLDIYRAKTGDEIVNEQVYSFVDRGDREVAIRPEMTPTVSRMVAGRRQELAYPVRWYSIPNLWRYERPQRGRLREHWQLNVDIFGVNGIEADHEIITAADSIMQAFKAKRSMYTIKINSRQLMNTLFTDYLKLDPTQAATMAGLIDRMHKMDYAEFTATVDALFQPHQREGGEPELLMEFLNVKTVNDLPGELRVHPSVLELQVLMDLLAKAGVTNFEFDPTLMRGFAYYTDIVFEVFDTHPENNRSMFGGGRYDGLVGLFGVEPIATAGFGMGDVTLQNFLETHELLPPLPPETDAYVILIGDVYEGAQPVFRQFRDLGVKLAIDTTGRKPDKQIKTAVKKNIHYALFIGEKELDDEQYVLKNLMTGTDERHGVERTVSLIKDYRRKKKK